MKEKIFRSKFFLLFLCFIYCPHVIAYNMMKNKDRDEVDKDIEVMNLHKNFYLKGTLALLYHLYTNKYYRNVFYLRLGWSSCLISWLMPRAIYFYPCKRIGGGVFLAHPYGTIINASSVGENFSVRQCTTIGNKRDGDGRKGPTIGNNVTLGANVCIVGDIIIGNNVVVGAGSVVVKNVPDNCVIAGNPAKIIKVLEK